MFSNYYTLVKKLTSPPKKNRSKGFKEYNTKKIKKWKFQKLLIIDLVQITLTFFPSPTSEGKIYLPTYI